MELSHIVYRLYKVRQKRRMVVKPFEHLYLTIVLLLYSRTHCILRLQTEDLVRRILLTGLIDHYKLVPMPFFQKLTDMIDIVSVHLVHAFSRK